AMVAAGQFREDLLYRLNVITLRVPPLRERTDDIPLLVEHFARKHGGGAEGEGRGERAGAGAGAGASASAGGRARVTRAAMAKLVKYPWPGNVRQLENEVRRALVLGDGEIDVPQLSEDVVRGGPPVSRAAGGADLRSRVDALEADLVQDALAKTRGNQTRAAQLLGVSRFGLQKMMKRLKIAPLT
ncbi:MAG: sigma-54-dependent Fis family transcriptional regulator, partial [Myxococcales bacterium]|nr:sigma-54-dependent Fis family transcriptional regulator [Myxococcales bacterium]